MVWAVGFVDAGWLLRWMTWEEFFQIVMSQSFHRIQDLHADLIVGGLSLATDYMWVMNSIIYHLNADIIFIAPIIRVSQTGLWMHFGPIY